MYRPAVIFILVVCASSAWAAKTAPVVKIALRPECTVQPGRSVALRDVADITGPAIPARKAGDMMVGIGPLPGKHRTVTSSYISGRAQALRIGAEVRVVGAEECDLAGSCVRWDSKSLSDAAEELVKSNLPQDGSVYETSVSRRPKEIVTAGGGRAELRARLLSSNVKAGLNTVAVDAMVDGQAAKTATVAVQVLRSAEALTALSAIPQGEPLTPQNTAWVRQDVTRMPNAVVRPAQGEEPNWVAKRSLTAGAVLTSVDVIDPPAIKRGDTVILMVKCGAVRLATTAEAKQDRRQGEMVAVRPASSDQNVTGRVVERGLVEIVR